MSARIGSGAWRWRKILSSFNYRPRYSRSCCVRRPIWTHELRDAEQEIQECCLDVGMSKEVFDQDFPLYATDLSWANKLLRRRTVAYKDRLRDHARDP